LTAQSQEKKTDQSTQPKNDIVKLNVDLVTLDAQVLRQNTNRIAWKLKQDDFILYEDGIKQKISNFSQDTLPLSVVLLIDRRGCLDPFSEKIQKAVSETVKNLKAEDELAVMTFSDKTELVSPFNTDKTKVVQTLSKLPAHDDSANHCFNVAFYDAANYMREAGNPVGRRVIILITGITKGINCGKHSSEEARIEVLESGSTVCAMVPHDPSEAVENGILHGAADIGKVVGVGTLNVRSLIEETGGEFVSAKPDNIEFLFDNLITRIRTRYAIGFVSTNTKRDGAYRRLKLQVTPEIEKREGKLIVRTRRGYLAPTDKKSDAK
jgi:VWFA-related protein